MSAQRAPAPSPAVVLGLPFVAALVALGPSAPATAAGPADGAWWSSPLTSAADVEQQRETRRSERDTDREPERRADRKAQRAAAAGVEPGTLNGGRVAQDGWWSKTNEPPPETGVLAPPAIPAVGAPAGTLPVASIANEPERVAAIEFALEGKPDSKVRSVKLALRESSGPGNANPAGAAISACPVTEAFWVGVDNGAWQTRPRFDCKSVVAGVRDDSGVWRFDLTPLARDWLASDREFSPAVVLVGTVDETPRTFQVAYDAKGLGLQAKVEAPKADPDDGDDPGEDTGTDDDGTEPSDPGLGTGGGGGSGGSGALPGGDTSGGGVGSLPAPPGGGGAIPEVPSAPPAEEEAVADETPSAGFAPAAASSPSWYDGIGRGVVVLLPLTLFLAYLLMVAMGPAGRPVVGGGRRGVSRALDRLRAAGPTLSLGKDRR